MAERAVTRKVMGLGLGAALALGAVLAVRSAQQLPDGPQPVAWDREACAHCRMEVGDPHYAAQLQTIDGRVLDFDDPGCLLRYLDGHHPAVHAVYFHALRGDGWLTQDQAAFVDAGPTPMGYGLGAVPAGTPGSITVEQARARLRQAALAAKGTP